ncbi:hypothetical protein BDV98DRAFT_361879 [Pterulicium gracile]|uniref:Uncharacterized protein n=1 Tax=Pterulicium gracile TaxID=1884261 RepID=A0A5C3QTG2_9AGAR|nr:hypothetical protein BDV98DRAFT_361879 [Pterula gracilis]
MDRNLLTVVRELDSVVYVNPDCGIAKHCSAIVREAYVSLSFRSRCIHRFVDVFFKAFLPPMIHNGVASECHPQNTLARFDMKTGQLLGFIIRDFGGIRVQWYTARLSSLVPVSNSDS